MNDERYSRQAILPEIGPAGQARLASSSALVVGAGGLGAPVALYLAAMGVGRIGLIDGEPYCGERDGLANGESRRRCSLNDGGKRGA